VKKLKIAKKIIFILFLPLGILLSYVASQYPEATERFFSQGLYPMVGQNLSLITGVLPISVAEFMILLLILCFIRKVVQIIWKMLHRDPKSVHALVNVVLNFFIAFSIVYFTFNMVWGFNYYRLPFSQLAHLEVAPASVEELAELCDVLISQANRLRDKIGQIPSNSKDMPQNYRDILAKADLGYQAASAIYPQLGGEYGKPKPVLLSELMSFSGIAGMYFPFTGEANVNVSVPLFMLPSTVCHEMAHQRGFAREDEANYIAYLTCKLHPDPYFQYSGTMLALIHSMNTLYEYDPGKYISLHRNYNSGVSQDLAQLSAFWEKYEGPVEETTEKINDTYLKANRQAEGVDSYGRMIDLLLAELRQKMKNAN